MKSRFLGGGKKRKKAISCESREGVLECFNAYFRRGRNRRGPKLVHWATAKRALGHARARSLVNAGLEQFKTPVNPIPLSLSLSLSLFLNCSTPLSKKPFSPPALAKVSLVKSCCFPLYSCSAPRCCLHQQTCPSTLLGAGAPWPRLVGTERCGAGGGPVMTGPTT